MNYGMINVGEILRKIREKTGVSQKKVYFGLCSKSMYSTYEDGTNTPPWLLLHALLQRMGKSAEKLNVILTAEEYQYLCWKEKILEAIECGDNVRVQRLLEQPTAQKVVIHKKLQDQFYLLMQTVVMRKTKEARAQKECYIRLLKQAVELTMPGIRPQNMEQYLIGESEMQILLELAEGLIFVGEEEEAYAFLKAMLQHIERHYEDYELKVKVYPKAVRLILPLMRKNHEQIEAMVLCKKAIELLCWLGVLYDLQELLDVYLELCKATAQEEEYAQFQKYAWALHEVCRTFGEGREQSEGTMLSYQNQELYLVNEVIRSGRICRKLTQDQLSEAISCTPETMSRIESGKRSPSTKNFRALLNETKTDLDYFNSELVTEDFEVLEKTQELDQAIFLYDWKEAERLLDVIKEKLNSDYPQNEGFIKLKECCIRYNQGEIGAEEFLTACEERMGCAHEEWENKEFWNQFFTWEKVYTMNTIACLYKRNQQLEKAIPILEHLLEKLDTSGVELADRYKSSILVLSNLSGWYGRIRQKEKCKEICDKGIKLCLKSGRLMHMGAFLANQAEIMDEIAGFQTEESRLCIQCAYYISMMTSDTRLTAYLDQYYRANYNPDMIWD